MKKKALPVEREELLNLWLGKFHNTSVDEVKRLHPPEVLKDWIYLYPVTQEQHDEWMKDVVDYITSNYNVSKKIVKRSIGWISLDCGPYVKEHD